MKKIALAGLIVVAAALALPPASDAHDRFRHRPIHSRVVVGFGFGPAYWGYPYPYWYYPPPYVVYSPAPVVVQETPPVYIQQTPPPPPAAPQYWYYCESAKGYYPAAPSCPEPWVPVAPRP
jgi:hypothetical protein